VRRRIGSTIVLGCANICSVASEQDQRAIVRILLREHPRMVPLPDLRAAEGIERPDEAVHHLVADGVAVRLGDLVGVTHAALRFGQLMAEG
jgi:hypothetical protein